MATRPWSAACACWCGCYARRNDRQNELVHVASRTRYLESLLRAVTRPFQRTCSSRYLLVGRHREVIAPVARNAPAFQQLAMVLQPTFFGLLLRSLRAARPPSLFVNRRQWVVVSVAREAIEK